MASSYGDFSSAYRQELWRRCKNGEEDARSLLIESNYGLVGHVVKRFSLGGEGYEELFQSGVMGLIESVDRFLPEEGTAFPAYAVPYIGGEIRRFFEQQRGQKRRREQELLGEKIHCVRDAFLVENLREPTYTELAALVGIGFEELVLLLEQWEKPLSLEETEIFDAASADSFAAAENRIWIAQLLEEVEEKQRKIITARYFLGKTQQEVGKELSLSQTRVSRLEKEALTRLRKISQR